MFYGSQTGTGEEFANRLSKDAQRYGMKGMAADPEEYDMVCAAAGPEAWVEDQTRRSKLPGLRTPHEDCDLELLAPLDQ